jgi:AraC-like DNA-binding protein
MSSPYYGGPRPKLADWEIAELRRRAADIRGEYPEAKWRRPNDGRAARLQLLAEEYGISRRTLYRYLEKAA